MKNVQVFCCACILFIATHSYAFTAHQQLHYSTYMGGSQNDWISGLCTDETGNVYVTGTTSSGDFPFTSTIVSAQRLRGESDVFVAKFNRKGELLHCTLLGGCDYEGNSQIALDPTGQIVVVGVTKSGDFPTTQDAFDRTYNGDCDVFVTKLNANINTILYSTFLGGANQDHHPIVVVDDAGDIILCGPTRSSNFPTTDNAYDSSYNGTAEDGYYGDLFVAKFSAQGDRLLYSSFIGGKNEETVFGIDCDSQGIVYLTGLTQSEDFPCQHSLYGGNYQGHRTDSHDAYVLGIDCERSTLVVSTLFGGGRNEQGAEVEVCRDGSILVAGNTASSDFPTTIGAFQSSYAGGGTSWKSGDLFVSRLDPSGKHFIYSTYVGGCGDEGWCDLAVDSQGNAWVGGGTSSSNFPTTENALDTTFNNGDNNFIYRDAFLFGLDPTGSRLLYATYLGGTGDDNVFKLDTDSRGNVTLGGLTISLDFPVAFNAYSAASRGQRDAFVMTIRPLPQDGDPISIGHRRQFTSDILGEERGLQIRLPRDYEQSDLAYPVLYCLDGEYSFVRLLTSITNADGRLDVLVLNQ
ncbi:SBBP repeat-containing protein [Planctomycetota bacterium]